MDLPDGSQLFGRVGKLMSCIYRLKESARQWYNQMIEYLESCGFAITAWDRCVVVYESGDLVLAIYVYDIPLCGTTEELTQQTVKVLKREFKVNDMGEHNWFQEIQITFTDDGITASQTTFIVHILNHLLIPDCKPVLTPIDPNHQSKANCHKHNNTNKMGSQQIIGSLMYLVTGTSPHLAYTITHLTQFNSSHTMEHLTMANQVLRYLQETKTKSLFHP